MFQSGFSILNKSHSPVTFKQFFKGREITTRRSERLDQPGENTHTPRSLAGYSIRHVDSISSSFTQTIDKARSTLEAAREKLKVANVEQLQDSTIDQWIGELQGAQQEVQSVTNYENDAALSTADTMMTNMISNLEELKQPTAAEEVLTDNEMLTLLQDLKNGSSGIDAIKEQAQQIVGNTTETTTEAVYTVSQTVLGTLEASSGNDQGSSDVARLANGNYVVIWEEGTSGSREIRGQIYQEDGTKVGGELQLNYDSGSDDHHASVTALNGGGFVVSWTTEANAGVGIIGQLFQDNGTASGEQFVINTTTWEEQTNSQVVALADGGFAAVWQSEHNEFLDFLVDDNDIYFKRYDATGNVTQEQTAIKKDWFDDQVDASITALNGGGYAITWTNADDGVVRGSVFDANGDAIRTKFQLDGNEVTTNQGSSSIISLDDGGFVATWTADDADGTGIYAQRYDASGNELWSQPIRINESHSGEQNNPLVTLLHDGNLAFAWTSNNNPGSTLVARMVDQEGSAISDELQVASYEGLFQTNAAILATDDGFRMMWTGETGQIAIQDVATGSGETPQSGVNQTASFVNDEISKISDLLSGISTGNNLQDVGQEAYYRLHNLVETISELDATHPEYNSLQGLRDNLNSAIGTIKDHVTTRGLSITEKARHITQLANEADHAIDLLKAPRGSRIESASPTKITSTFSTIAGDKAAVVGEFVIYKANLDNPTAPHIILDQYGSVEVLTNQDALLKSNQEAAPSTKTDGPFYKEARLELYAKNGQVKPIGSDPTLDTVQTELWTINGDDKNHHD